MYGHFSAIAFQVRGSALPTDQTTTLEVSEQQPDGRIHTERYQFGEVLPAGD